MKYAYIVKGPNNVIFATSIKEALLHTSGNIFARLDIEHLKPDEILLIMEYIFEKHDPGCGTRKTIGHILKKCEWFGENDTIGVNKPKYIKLSGYKLKDARSIHTRCVSWWT